MGLGHSRRMGWGVGIRAARGAAGGDGRAAGGHDEKAS